MNMIKFEVGRVYANTRYDDMNCKHVSEYKIISRTASTVTVELPEIAIAYGFNRIRKYRILKGLSEFNGAETIAPWGQYSMCEYVYANK